MAHQDRLSILIVDDNADMRDTLKALVEVLGYRARTATDGHEALQLQRNEPAQILITDIFMPGAEGIETIAMFKREWPQMKVVAMSGGGEYAQRNYLRDAAFVGADATLQKPFTLEVLQKTLEDLGA